MIGKQIAPFLTELQNKISQKNTYYGNRMPKSIMDLFEVEIRETGAGLLVPSWLSVMQRGRGPRKNTKDHNLKMKIYKWMESRNLFKSNTAKGKLNEAKFIAMYINKYGNKQFRTKTYIDIYDTERKITMKKIDDQFGILIGKMTMDVI